MPITTAKRLAIEKYRREKRDRLSVDVPKGKRAAYNEKAAVLGLSLAQMIQRAVEAYGGADDGAGASTKTQAESAETTQNAQVNGEVPIIYSERNQTAQNQPVSTNVQTIQPATENVPQRITGNEKRLIEAVKTLTPESQKALLKFLQTLQG